MTPRAMNHKQGGPAHELRFLEAPGARASVPGCLNPDKALSVARMTTKRVRLVSVAGQRESFVSIQHGESGGMVDAGGSYANTVSNPAASHNRLDANLRVKLSARDYSDHPEWPLIAKLKGKPDAGSNPASRQPNSHPRARPRGRGPFLWR